MPEAPQKFFLTTPIYYVNARPHIGHAYTTIVADVLARSARAAGIDTWFLTGTDEHGQKIERSAAVAGIEPQTFTDQVSLQFRSLWDRMGLTYDQFIRTTDPAHKRGAQKLFATLYERGFIYLASYTGQYCVSDEAFVDVPAGAPCPDCGRITETLTEENFFFKLSEFQRKLLDLIESGELAITPEAAKNEVLSFIRGGLKDLSISRSSFTWGIPVPEPAASAAAQKHVIYVWLDALANYMTALGYGSEDETLWEKYWRDNPNILHLVGKEITRFHCVYWPAFLMAAGIKTPKAITANGWLLFDNAKMSKSRGNVVRAETILETFGTLCPPQSAESVARVVTDRLHGRKRTDPRDLFATDVLRYYLLREIPFGQDGSFSFDALITRYNADLANGYGNLVSRTISMMHKYFSGIVSEGPPDQTLSEILADLENLKPRYDANAIRSLMESLPEIISKFLDDFDFASALKSTAMLVSTVDQMLTGLSPWKMNSDEPGERVNIARTLYVATESIRIITLLLYPILPYATASVWAQLGLGDIEQAAREGKLANLQWGGLQPGTKLGPLSPIFPRADKGLAQIMEAMESPLEAITTQHDAAHPAKDDLPVAPLASEQSVSLGVSSVLGLSSAPDAGPRTTTLAESNPGAQVAASTATTTERPGTPSHTEAASGIFAHQPTDASPQIGIDDFVKVELRVAKIVVCERIPKADKLLRLEVDLGYETRQILSGIAEWYTPEELIGRRIVVIVNLAPRKMRGLESHGMLLAASSEGGKPYLATFADAEALPLGSRLK